jgi:hypothetical protein
MTAGRVRVDGELVSDLETATTGGTWVVVWTGDLGAPSGSGT